MTSQRQSKGQIVKKHVDVVTKEKNYGKGGVIQKTDVNKREE